MVTWRWSSGVGAEAVGVEVDRAQAGGAGTGDVVGDGVADVEALGRVDAHRVQGEVEDGGVGLRHADDVGVDDDRDRHTGALAHLAQLGVEQLALDGPVGVAHHAHRHPGVGQRPQPWASAASTCDHGAPSSTSASNPDASPTRSASTPSATATPAV